MKFIINPDNKVEKAKKKRSGLYQSSQHPEHFSNEGGEYSTGPESKSKQEANKDIEDKNYKKDDE